jgi:hypothetical protein
MVAALKKCIVEGLGESLAEILERRQVCGCYIPGTGFLSGADEFSRERFGLGDDFICESQCEMLKRYGDREIER